MIEGEPGGHSRFGDVLLLLPDLTVLLVRLLRDERVPRLPKLIALVGVGYVLSPIDLLPALLLGPLGLSTTCWWSPPPCPVCSTTSTRTWCATPGPARATPWKPSNASAAGPKGSSGAACAVCSGPSRGGA